MRGKQRFIILLVVFMSFGIVSKMNVSAKEQDTVTAYDMPAEMPDNYVSPDFEVMAEGVDVNVYYGGNNAWGNGISFASFDFTGRVSVTVTTNFSFTSARILPRSSGIDCSIHNNTITFELDEPQNITIIFDENFQGRALHLFGQGKEQDIPDLDDSNVIYFAPGYYDYSD